MGAESTSLILNIQREGTDGVSMRVQLGFWRHEATVQQKGKAWRSISAGREPVAACETQL